MARARRVLLFVAIVWSVAASLVVLELVLLAGVDAAAAHPGLFGNIAVTNSASRSTLCEMTGASPAAPASQFLAGAWTLGLRLGQEAQARQSTTVNAETLTQARAAVEQLATILHVPAPAPFQPADLVTANIELINTVEADAQGTAKGLAAAYSSASCRLYKLGAVWGEVAIARAFLPGDRPPLTAELRFYAQQASLPDALWKPMTEPSPSGATGQEIFAESQTLTSAVTTYLLQTSAPTPAK